VNAAAVQWLLEQRTAFGGYRSTQDTIVALKALTDFAKSASKPTLTVRVKSPQKEFKVTPETFDVAQFLTLPGRNHTLSLDASVKGTAVGVIAMHWHDVPEPRKPCFRLEMEWQPPVGGGHDVLGCVQPEPYCKLSSMMMVDVGLVSGQALTKESLTALKSTAGIDRVDVDDGKISVYTDAAVFDKKRKLCFRFATQQEFEVAGLKPVVSQAYLYYEPEIYGVAKVEWDAAVSASKQKIPNFIEPTPGVPINSAASCVTGLVLSIFLL